MHASAVLCQTDRQKSGSESCVLNGVDKYSEKNA